jgi:hypothetical protein
MDTELPTLNRVRDREPVTTTAAHSKIKYKQFTTTKWPELNNLLLMKMTILPP